MHLTDMHRFLLVTASTRTVVAPCLMQKEDFFITSLSFPIPDLQGFLMLIKFQS